MIAILLFNYDRFIIIALLWSLLCDPFFNYCLIMIASLWFFVIASLWSLHCDHNIMIAPLRPLYYDRLIVILCDRFIVIASLW